MFFIGFLIFLVLRTSGDSFFFGPTKRPFGDYVLFFGGFLSKSKLKEMVYYSHQL